MLDSHYAPGAAVVLAETRTEAQALLSARPGAVVIDMTDDLTRYARTLYSALRDADERNPPAVIAVLPPAIGLGHAIRDRLGKAAAPRPGG